MTLFQLIAEIESGKCPYALRYEPLFEPSAFAVAKIKRAHRPAYMSDATARMVAQTSWGSVQIMGENIWTICEFDGTYQEFVNSYEAQERCFRNFLTARGIDYSVNELKQDPEKRARFARRYNGSTEYAKKIMNIIGRVS